MGWNFGNFRRALVRERERRRWTLRTAAGRIGISETALRNLEEGKRCPTVKTLIAIAKAYNTSPNDLMGRWE